MLRTPAVMERGGLAEVTAPPELEAAMMSRMRSYLLEVI